MSTRATLLGLLILLALAAGGALWFATGGGASGVPAGAAPAHAPEPPAPADGGIDLAAVPAAGRGAPEREPGADGRPQPGVRAPGEGRLAGTVVDRASGRPVPGARVELHAFLPAGGPLLKRILPLFGGQAQPYLGTGEPLAVVDADGAGGFAFEGVRGGGWFVQARGQREVPDGVTAARVSASGEGGPLEVFVRAGGRVVGTVLAPEGAPAAGARVLLLPGVDHLLESLRSGDLCVLESATAGDGRFALAGVPPGPSYDLFVEGQGFPVSFVTGIAVAAGRDTELTVQTRPGGSVSGRVLSVGDPEHPREPLAGAHVAVVPHGLRYLPFAAAVLAATHGVSDAEGRFVLHDVPPGEVDLIGIAPGHAPTIGPTLFVAEGALAAAPDFELPVGPSAAGRVVDGNGQPLAGVRVTWDPVDLEGFGLGNSFAPFVAQALRGLEFPVTGADGRFTAGAFPGEPPHSITFDKPGYARKVHRWEPGTLPEGEELEIVLDSGGFIEGIVMDVEKSAPVASFFLKSEALVEAPGELQIGGELGAGLLVEDEGGRFRIGPLQPGQVSLEVDAPDFAMTLVSGLQVAAGETLRGVIVELYGGQRVRGRVVDEAGLPVAGALLVPSYQDSWTAPEGEAEGATQQRGRPDTHSPYGLTAYAAQLGLSGPGTARSEPDGSFELRGVEAGTLRIGAVHREHATSWSETVEVLEGGDAVEVLIEMQRGGAIFGRVVDRFDRPVEGAMVLAAEPNQMESDEPRGGEAVYQGRTDAEGSYRIERVGPGIYFLVLTRGDAVLNPMSFLGTLNFDLVTVPEGKEVEYDIVDGSIGGTRVFGRVIARGEPLGGGQVTALGFESDSLLGFDMKIARVHPDGSYEFEGLAPGEYRLNVGGPDLNGDASMMIDVPNVPEYQLDLALPEGRIAGRVLDAGTRAPIHEVWVTAQSSLAVEPEGIMGSVIGRGAGRVSDRSEENGAFALERLQAGEYELSVRGSRQGYVLEEPLTVELGHNQSRDGLEILLQPGLALAGVVTALDGGPLEGARVSAWIEGRMETLATASTGEQGRFELGGLRPGTYAVRVTHPDFAARRLSAVRIESGSEPLEVALEPGLLVSVLVLDTRGQPVSGAFAQLSENEGGAELTDAEQVFGGLFEGRGLTDANGLVELGHYAPGTYALEAQRGGDRASEQVTLAPGSGDARLSIRLR